jgi:hypothetical protein
MTIAILILHGLLAVGLLGAVTHQFIAAVRRQPVSGDGFVERYRKARAGTFTGAVVVLFLVNAALGAWLYPSYRLDVRIPFEEMGLGWAVGLFELKEHFAGIALGLLPAYWWAWRAKSCPRAGRLIVTSTLAFIIWWDFLVGHVLNNIRGLS